MNQARGLALLNLAAFTQPNYNAIFFRLALAFLLEVWKI